MKSEHVRLSTVILRRMLIVGATILCIAALALMNAGCAILTPPSEEATLKTIPVSLKQPCPPLTPLQGMTGTALENKIIEVAEQYYDCAGSKLKLIRACQ